MTREKHTEEDRKWARQYLDQLLDDNDRLIAELEQQRTQAIASRAASLWVIGWVVLTLSVGLVTSVYFGLF